VRRFAPALMLVASFAAPATASAQATPVTSVANVLDVKAATYVRDQYLTELDSLHSKIVALANAIPAEKYAWRPAEGVRSVSEALMHVASEYYFFAPRSLGANPPADFGPPRESLPKLEKITDKTAVLAELDKAWTHCRGQFASVDPAQLTGAYKPWNMTLVQSTLAMTGDLHEHLGQLIAYARSVGVTPPWSK